MSIKENVEYITSLIRESATKSGRKPEDITLIGVSKTFPSDKIIEAYGEGIINFGENKAQELSDKLAELNLPAKWHFIGHLQTNKVKKVIGNAHLIHSVDSVELADELQRQAQKKDIIQDILIQVNIAEEPTKFGIKKEDVLFIIENIKVHKNIKIKGLMTIGPHTDDKSKIREVFRELKNIYEEIKSSYGLNENIDFQYLSMGMSSDFDIAIEEGSNMVRIGSAIFGERNYLKEGK